MPPHGTARCHGPGARRAAVAAALRAYRLPYALPSRAARCTCRRPDRARRPTDGPRARVNRDPKKPWKKRMRYFTHVTLYFAQEKVLIYADTVHSPIIPTSDLATTPAPHAQTRLSRHYAYALWLQLSGTRSDHRISRGLDGRGGGSRTFISSEAAFLLLLAVAAASNTAADGKNDYGDENGEQGADEA